MSAILTLVGKESKPEEINPVILQLREYKITCPHCKKQAPFREWGFVQTHWHESPHGCSGGSCWNTHDDILQCLVVCPFGCSDNNHNLASRIYDVPMNRQDKNWVFGLITQVTHLWENKLTTIFAKHYVQYGESKVIESSEELRSQRENDLACC